MTKLVLDTGVLINLVRGNRIADQVKEYIDSAEDPQLFISVVTLAEAESLVVKWGWGDQKVNNLKRLIDELICIDIMRAQEEIIDAYVRMDAFSQGKASSPVGTNLDSSSRNMGKNDLWIAATAFTLNAQLLTIDKDFEHLNNSWIKVVKFDAR